LFEALASVKKKKKKERKEKIPGPKAAICSLP
jgi:hypothetical protein